MPTHNIVLMFFEGIEYLKNYLQLEQISLGDIVTWSSSKQSYPMTVRWAEGLTNYATAI